MIQVELFWKSTSDDRYETDMLSKTDEAVQVFLVGSGGEVVEDFGGTEFDPEVDNAFDSDNGIVVKIENLEVAEVLRQELEGVVKTFNAQYAVVMTLAPEEG